MYIFEFIKTFLNRGGLFKTRYRSYIGDNAVYTNNAHSLLIDITQQEDLLTCQAVGLVSMPNDIPSTRMSRAARFLLGKVV